MTDANEEIPRDRTEAMRLRIEDLERQCDEWKDIAEAWRIAATTVTVPKEWRVDHER